MNKFLTNLGQTFSDDEKAVIKNKLENILGTDQVKMAWYPTVGNDGTIQWGLSAYSTQAPNPANIKGPQGEAGKDGEDGEPGTSVTITNIEEEGRTHVVTFSDGKSITITDGVDGAGVAIKGTVATKANLPTDAENGDAYIVTGEDGKLFVYANGWPDEGVAFTGPKGERGETPSFSFIDGETGIEIHVNDSEDPVAVIPYAVDGHSPIITTSATSTGNDIYIDGNKAFSVTNGIDGIDGKDGYTPSATTATVTGEGHPNSGTKVTLSWPADASWLSPVSFTAWNGNDGMAGDLPAAPTEAGKYVLNKPTEGDASWVDAGEGGGIEDVPSAGIFVRKMDENNDTFWTPAEQYYAAIKTYTGVNDLVASGVAQSIEIINHNNSTGTSYNVLTGIGHTKNGTGTFSAGLLPAHWTKMFMSANNAPAGNFVRVGVSAASNNTWYDIEPNITATETTDKKFAWDPTNNTWAAISEGGSTVFTAGDNTEYITNTNTFNYIPMKIESAGYEPTADNVLHFVLE